MRAFTAAWTSAEHVKHWFCPQGFSVPEAEVDPRVGGPFNFCMRETATGLEHRVRGEFAEITPDSRLAIDMSVVDQQGRVLFRAYTIATFTDNADGCRLEVTQHYTVLTPEALASIEGAPEGWRQTLDRLERLLAPGQAPAATRSVVHGMFKLERTYRASPAQVFHALTDPGAKARWFAGGDGHTILERTMDVRPGGRERVRGRWESGLVSTFDAMYFDVVPDTRIVYAYEMHLDDRKISVSLATFDLRSAGTGTRLVLTEHGAFLDGYDDAGSRERGTNFLLDSLGKAVDG